jgi:VWFA-related protein
MLRILTACCLSVFLCLPVLARGQEGQAAAEPAATIRTSSDLVVLDVVASDSRQNPIHQLTAGDFTVLEDGKPQTVKIFEEHQASPSVTLLPAPKLEPGTFTNYSVAPANGALNILLLDKLNTPLNAQSVVRDEVLKYIKQMPPGTRIAIFSLTTELKLLQGFTSNPEVLRALVAGKKGTQSGSPLMNDAANGDAPGGDNQMFDLENDPLGNDPTAATMQANLQQFEAEIQSYQLQLRARYTLDALNLLARYMSALPGRKNLIWFSGSFPINILPDGDLKDPFAVVASAEDEFRETVDLLTRAQVAVYPIDARGLMTNPAMDASRGGQGFTRNPSAVAKNNTQFFMQTSAEQGTMLQMAEATGGKAYVNTNGLKEAVEKAIEAGSNYYTIAYTPSDKNRNGNYRKIQVKVDRPGVTLAYRHGYFADDPNAVPRGNAAKIAKVEDNQYSAFRAAMLHGGPDPTELIFAASVRPAAAETETAVVPGNQASKKATGPYRRYTIMFMANPRVVKWEVTPDGTHHCTLEFATYVYDADGTPINGQFNGINAALSDEKFASLGNLKYVQQISVPAKGEYYLRIGIHDPATDHVGAVEIPVAAVAKLPPAAVPPPAPAAPAAVPPPAPAAPAK